MAEDKKGMFGWVDGITKSVTDKLGDVVDTIEDKYDLAEEGSPHAEEKDAKREGELHLGLGDRILRRRNVGGDAIREIRKGIDLPHRNRQQKRRQNRMHESFHSRTILAERIVPFTAEPVDDAQALDFSGSAVHVVDSTRNTRSYRQSCRRTYDTKYCVRMQRGPQQVGANALKYCNIYTI